ERSSSGAADKRIKFENPPINELAIALFHLPIMEMKSQHIGLYWNRIRDRYPLCEQRPPIAGAVHDPALQGAPNEIFPLPRFWFFRDSYPTLIQIQRNAFLLNWRRMGENGYPHYEAVVRDFWQEFESYKAFVQERGWKGLEVVRRCELTYINIISLNKFFTKPAELVNVLPSIASLFGIQTDDRQLVGINATATYQVNPTLQIDLAIKLGRRTDDTKELVAILELKAHGVPSDLSLQGMRLWYDAAHEATYTLFLESTDKKVQELIWKPI
ncbi:MAG: TIGR04255 family protein, partial [Nitrososphaera sp.]|nr:TIGR04255 family protein [Nitrososphaera sp.]